MRSARSTPIDPAGRRGGSACATLNGELLDFGPFRAVGDWSNVFPLDHMPGFGDELLLLVPAARSLSFFFPKYGPAGSTPPETALLEDARRALDARFDRECLRL
jgi:hypothetical protein